MYNLQRSLSRFGARQSVATVAHDPQLTVISLCIPRFETVTTIVTSV